MFNSYEDYLILCASLAFSPDDCRSLHTPETWKLGSAHSPVLMCTTFFFFFLTDIFNYDYLTRNYNVIFFLFKIAFNYQSY